MPPQNRIQACFPAGSQVIENLDGTAPGIDLEWPTADGHRCRCFALPGVPAEMRQMWQQSVQPAIERLRGPGRVICHHRLKCFGVGESELEAMLPDLIRRGRTPQVGITVHRATITLRVTAAGPDREHCWQAMQPTLQTIRESLGELVFGEEDEELQHAVIRQLADRRRSMSICEWGTRGLVTHWLCQVDDPADPRLQGSLVLHTSRSLQLLLGLSAEQTRGDAAERVAHMARAVRARCGTDYGLAIGELPDSRSRFKTVIREGEAPAEPKTRQTPARREPRPPRLETASRQPLPQVHLALDTPEGLQVEARSYAGHPDILLERTAKHALNLVRLGLLENKDNGPDGPRRALHC